MIKSDFEIITRDPNYLKLVFENKYQNGTIVPKRRWKYVGRVEAGTIYVESYYNEEKAKFDKAAFLIRDRGGNIVKEFSVKHGVYKFKAGEHSDRFVVSSDDLILYLYSLQTGCLGTYDLSGQAKDKYHIRNIDISPDGGFLLFTNVDKVTLMDSNFKSIGNWETPLRDGWEKRINGKRAALTKDIQGSLSILGLSGKPTNEEVKRSFRTMIFRQHPDRNPNDPKATDKAREIINAYEKLTGEEAKQAFRGIENAEYYYKLYDKIKIEIPGTSQYVTIEMGMCGAGEDWIYATWLDLNADKIVLGCYSGKVYSITNNDNILKIHDVNEVVTSIREKGCYLYIETDHSLSILKEGNYLIQINKLPNVKLRWADNGFTLIGTKEISLFSDAGIELGKVKFKNSIYDLYWMNENMIVVTANKARSFSYDHLAFN